MMDLSLTAEERAERLIDLASSYDDVPGTATDLALREWAHPALTPEEQRDHLTDLSAAVIARDNLASGFGDWQSIDPDLTCPNKREVAEQIACERVDEALHPLVFGPFRTTKTGAAA